MVYVVTYIEVQPSYTSAALELISRYCNAVREEKWNSGIDAVQEIHRQHRFALIEVWADESSFQIHENAPHTVQFRSKLSESHNSPYDQRVHHAFAIGARAGEAGPVTLFVVTHVDVPPPRKDETEILLKRLAEQSLTDEGNVRYDVFQQNAPRTNHFTVVEAWNDENAFASHEAKPHTRQFREALGPMLGAPYDDRLYKMVHSSKNA